MQALNISVVQTTLVWEDTDANLAHLESMISDLQECDLIVLPEMFTTGFSMRPEMFARYSGVRAEAWLIDMSVKLGAAICGSYMRCEDDRYYNTLGFATPDGFVQRYNKRHLFSPGAEAEHYSKGRDRLVLEYKGWKICPLICYDLRFPVFSRNTEDFDLMLYVANWPEVRNYAWQQLLKARAIENQCYVVACNRIGDDANGVKHAGNSCIVNFSGEEIGFGSDQKVFRFYLDKRALDAIRKQFPVLGDRDAFTLS